LRFAVTNRTEFDEGLYESGYEATKANNELAGTRPTKCVVSILVAVRGTSGPFMSRCNCVSDVCVCLQNLDIRRSQWRRREHNGR
jgi:hypothetical protein